MSGDDRDRTILIVSMCPGDALRAARRLGLRVVMLTDAALTWQAEYLDRVIDVSPFDQRAAAAALDSHVARHGTIGAAMTFDERAVPVTASLAARLGARGNSVEAAYAARNKYVMRVRCAEHGLASPRFALAADADDALRIAQESIGYPLVLKPLFGFASLGVVRIDAPPQLATAFAATMDVARQARVFVEDDPYRDSVMLEQYIGGRELAVDGILEHERFRCVGLFDKPELGDGPTFEDTLYVTPSLESDALQAEILETVGRSARALGLITGAVHAEVRVDVAGPRLIEIGARPIGGICGRAHSYCLGVDYAEIVLRNALGESPPLPQDDRTPAGVMMIPVTRAGRVSRVEGVREAREVEGIRDVLLMARVGDRVGTESHEACYLGFVLACGESVHHVRRALLQARSLISCEVEPVSSVV